jgi:putative heme-binding domain-containing protein
MGLQVFERNACTKCHTTATQTTPLAPSLKGIGSQKVDYLIESVLYPSKVIKTGFETELIVTKSGQTLTGLVKEEGDFLRVLDLATDTKIAKAEVEERRLQKISIMPEGQELLLSRREFVDLMAYLQTLK